jgi:hypothetical protein
LDARALVVHAPFDKHLASEICNLACRERMQATLASGDGDDARQLQPNSTADVGTAPNTLRSWTVRFPSPMGSSNMVDGARAPDRTQSIAIQMRGSHL